VFYIYVKLLTNKYLNYICLYDTIKFFIVLKLQKKHNLFCKVFYFIKILFAQSITKKNILRRTNKKTNAQAN
jgi:hypothetical protein